ncbi:NUDIX hydrolase [Chthonomonas calidirosea]|uniref:NUDIX hydrolase n=1 Tax=Chthonomonas calidirosea TaxID=454171 RepID=UPI0006ECB3D4|nr:NUDIX domain-containing protein [Chthonomonas calidirosea]CEK18458.1 ADP-ribose pyrophosphatase [Chthonomonas calidirosea]
MNKERFYFHDPLAPSPNVPLSPGVSAVLMDSIGRILFLKRHQSDYWSLPGGRIDLLESAAECCIREVLEETGLSTRVVRLISINTDPTSIVAYPDGNVHRSFVLCFLVEHVEGKLRLGEEATDFRWCTPSDLESLLVIPDSRQNALDAWANRLTTFIR